MIILGRTGQVGRALLQHFGHQAVALDRSQVDLSRPRTIRDGLLPYLERHRPKALFLAAAYTAVDQAEKESDLAFAINGEAPGKVAEACRELEVPLVHYSTDYVFSGENIGRPWRETDPVNPLSVYGKSKLIGEQAIAAAGGRWLCFRISWVYDAEGKNFFRTMLRLAAEREIVSVVNDQHGTPNDAAFIARISALALDAELERSSFRSDIYHLSRAGSTTWFGFATEIFSRARAAGVPLKLKECRPISTSEYPTPAKRPGWSVLNCSKLKNHNAHDSKWDSVLGNPWTGGLDQCWRTWSSF